MTNEKMENTTPQSNTRTARAQETREKNARRGPWKPPSALEAPEPPEGYVHRWIRAEVMGFDDRKNVSAMSREGWELVRGDEYPDFDAPTIDDGKHAGVIGVGGLLLGRLPIEIAEQRDNYYRARTRDQMAAVDNELARSQHPAMAIHKPERETRVTFGGSRKSED
jgi:hypothetical protein|tara:strand:- start:444 stop:941 length:498 start_codon:yes stop_codon:yes gene_type:complete